MENTIRTRSLRRYFHKIVGYSLYLNEMLAVRRNSASLSFAPLIQYAG